MDLESVFTLVVLPFQIIWEYEVFRKTCFAALAFLFSLAAYAPYAWEVFKNRAHPTLSSWISWLAMNVVILAGMLAQGTIAWQMVAYILGISLIIVMSLWKKIPLGWKRLDTFCVVSVGIAIVLWISTENPNTAIVISVAADCVGTVPMLVNIWHKPEREPYLPWILTIIGGGFGVLAIQKMSIADALTPIVFFALQALIVLFLTRKFFRTVSAAH